MSRKASREPRGGTRSLAGLEELDAVPEALSRTLTGMPELTFRERPAAGEPAGLLVLHHGRGADEHDLLGLADMLDPQRRLHVATPRAPLTLPGWPGHHWYVCLLYTSPSPRDRS